MTPHRPQRRKKMKTMSYSTSRSRIAATVAVAVTAGIGLAACGESSSPQADSPDAGAGDSSSSSGGSLDGKPTPKIYPFPSPDEFVDAIDNPYLPLAPGTRWVYEGTSSEGEERIVVTVSDRTRQVAGVDATVVRDTVTQNGKVIEDTWDWYAQDADGNVWYLGEYTEAYEDGKTSTEGSWEAGKDGAQAGIVMLANPTTGALYHQEYDKGEAEDYAEVLSVDASAKVPFGSFDGMVKTLDVNPFEPNILEHKYYARGIGFVYEKKVQGDDGVLSLVSMSS
jgi:hypothetical protein